MSVRDTTYIKFVLTRPCRFRQKGTPNVQSRHVQTDQRGRQALDRVSRTSAGKSERWRHPIDHNSRLHGNDAVQRRKATGFAPEEAAKLENWFEVHTNFDMQAKRSKKHPEIQVGGEVKLYKQRSVRDEGIVSGYPRDPVKVKRVSKSLGQKFFEPRAQLSEPTLYCTLKENL